MDYEDWEVVFSIFFTTAFFASMTWLNRRVKSENYTEGKTTTRTKIEGFTHSMISSLIAVAAFAGITHFHPDWELLFQGSLAVATGAFLSEAIIMFAERRLNNDKLL